MKSFTQCPVCGSDVQLSVREDLKPHPYVGCGGCGLYYQPTPVDKVYEAPHEQRGDLMNAGEKAVNNMLASHLLSYWQKVSTPEAPHYHLDIGTKYPYLGHCIQNLSNISF